jgi:hypothetical protein
MIDHDNDGDNIDPTSNPLVNVTCVVVMIAAGLFGFNWFTNRPIVQGQQATTVQAPIAPPVLQPPIATPIATPSATPTAVIPPPVAVTPALSPAAVQTPATAKNDVKSTSAVKAPAGYYLTKSEREEIARDINARDERQKKADAVSAKIEANMKPWEKTAAATD